MSAVGNNTSDSTETRDDVTRTITPMKWTKKHDILLCKEILLTEPYKYKKGSVNKGKAWSTIADTLNCSQDPKFKVTKRSVRERFALIQEKYEARNNKDKRSSGTSAETTELDDLIEEITGKERAAEENRVSEDNMKKLETDRPKAEEARRRVSQTTRRLREEGDDWKNSKRKRSSENDTTERERSRTKRAVREEQAKAAQQKCQKLLSEMMQLLQQQQQLLKQQQEQSQAMLTVILKQHQDQGQALLSLVDSMLEKQ